MPVCSGVAVVFLQDSGATQHDLHVAMICLAVIAVALVLQALGVLVASAMAARVLMQAKSLVGTVETKTGPVFDQTGAILNQTRELLADLTPRLRRMTESAEQISTTVQTRVEDLSATVTELNDTMREINGRTREQVKRVDGMVSEALDATEEISRTVQQGIKGPVKQMAGLIAGVQAAIKTLMERSPFKTRV